MEDLSEFPQDLEIAVSEVSIKSFNGDARLILDYFAKYDVDITPFLPLEFRDYANDIKQLKGSQLNNLIGSIFACAGSLFAFSMNGAIAAQCTSLPLVVRAAIASSPLLIGGFLRVSSAYQADQGHGKEIILHLLGLSLVGMLGNIFILHFMLTNENLSTITLKNFWPLMIAGAFIGLGLGTYASGMIIGARSASNPNINWEENLNHISNILTTAAHREGTLPSDEIIQIQPGFISQKLSFILRKNAAIYSAVIAGIANTSPSIPITINAYAENLKLKNSTRTIIFAGIQCFIMLCIHKLLNNPVYDQLRKNNPQLSHEEAKKLAIYMGQTLFANDRNTLWNELKNLTHEEKKELWMAVIFYSASYGVLTAIATTGSFTMVPRCVPRINASLIIARSISMSSLFRSIPLSFPAFCTPSRLNKGSLLVMGTSMGLFAFVDKKYIPETMMYAYAISVGIVCFAVVARLVKKTPHKVGLVTGASSGVGAFVGLPFSLIMAWLQEYNPNSGFCADDIPHNTMSLQLLLPVVVCTAALLYLLIPELMRASARNGYTCKLFKPLPTTSTEEILYLEEGPNSTEPLGAEMVCLEEDPQSLNFNS